MFQLHTVQKIRFASIAQASVVTAALELFEATSKLQVLEEYSAHTYQVKRKGARLPTHQVKSFFLPEVEMRSHEIGNPTLSSVIRIWMMGCHTDGYLVQCSLLR